MSRPTIVLSGLWYPMAILRYFERALKLASVNLITVGPYTGDYIPWNGGMRLNPKYANPPTVELPNGVVDFRFVEAELASKHKIVDWDAWIQVDAAYGIAGRPSHGTHIIIATDPHCIDYRDQRRSADYFYIMQPAYKATGDLVLPYAYDHTCHYPLPKNIKYDVGMIGVMYPHRQQLIRELRERGHRVLAETGPVFHEATALLAMCRLGLNWSSLNDLNARFFELSAMNVPAVHNIVTGMEEFLIPNEDFIAFGEPHWTEGSQLQYVSDAVAAIERGLAMSQLELTEMSMRAYRKIRNGNNSYYDRIFQVMRDVVIDIESPPVEEE